jgi:hypothetical protein
MGLPPAPASYDIVIILLAVAFAVGFPRMRTEVKCSGLGRFAIAAVVWLLCARLPGYGVALALLEPEPRGPPHRREDGHLHRVEPEARQVPYATGRYPEGPRRRQRVLRQREQITGVEEQAAAEAETETETDATARGHSEVVTERRATADL